jgi:hypothetical protein
MVWLQRGVYFFMEGGEHRTDSGEGLRIVRVGTHAADLDVANDTMETPLGASWAGEILERQSPRPDLPAAGRLDTRQG